MKKILLSFGGSEVGKNRHNESFGLHRNYTAEVQRLFKSGESYGFDGYWEYDNNWLKKSCYYETNAKEVLDEPSFGWAFKPIVIYDALSMMDDGDCLLWVDSNDVLISDPQPIFDIAIQKGFYIHDHAPTVYLNKHWTHKDMFVGMNCDKVEYHNRPQVQVNIMGFCKKEKVLDIVEEWVMGAINYNIMIENKMKNYTGFVDHRHEQSLMTILVERHSLVVHGGYPWKIAHEEMGISL